MARNQTKTVSEALERAKENGEVFLVSLSREQLQRAGFDVSTFGYFESAKIYLQYYNDEYRLKYVFDSNFSEYYEKSDEVVYKLSLSDSLTKKGRVLRQLLQIAGI